jgi:Grx4 family monothiol glutaredoxin
MTNLDQEIKKILTNHKVILFMKGDKFFPKCGYSKLAIDILNNYDLDYATFDILQDEAIRDQLKIYSSWPTYPQLYVNSELIGGSDILKEMHANNELANLL